MTKKSKRLPRAANALSASTVVPSEQQPDELLLANFLKDYSFAEGDINGVQHGLHPIHYAVHMNNPKIIEILLKKGVAVDCIAFRSHALESTRKGVAIFKMNTGVDANQFDLLTPLHGAAESGRDNIVRLLLNNGANVNKPIVSSLGIQGFTALSRAAQAGHENVVRLLLDAGVNIGGKYESAAFALMLAVIKGHVTIVKLLIEKADDDEKYRACRGLILQDHTDIEKILPRLLKSNYFDVNAHPQNEKPLLHLAVINKKYRAMAILLNNKADINQIDDEGGTALHRAVAIGNREAVRILLERNAVVDMPSNENVTALYIAAQNGNIEILQRLLECKANTEICSKSGYTPLHIAAKKGNWEIVLILLKNGADVHAKTEDGETPLYLACQAKCDPKLIKLILEYGADVNVQSTVDKYTPLHIASAYGTSTIVNMLIHAGAHVNVHTKANLTPFHIAFSVGRGEIEFLARSRDESILILKSLVESGADIGDFANYPNIADLRTSSTLRCDRARTFTTDLAPQILELEQKEIEQAFKNIGKKFTPKEMCFRNGNLCITFNNEMGAQDFLKIMLLLSNSKQIQQENATLRLHYPFSIETTYYLERKRSFEQRIKKLQQLFKSSHFQIRNLTQERGDLIEVFFAVDHKKTIEVTTDDFSIMSDNKGIILRLPAMVLQKPCGKISESIVRKIQQVLDDEDKKYREQQNLAMQKSMRLRQEEITRQQTERKKREEEKKAQAEKEKEVEVEKRKNKKPQEQTTAAEESISVEPPNAASYGEIALHEAVRRGDIQRVKSLILPETEINAKNEEGNTLLHIAAIYEKGVILNFLLKRENIDISLKNNEGKTALQIAEEKELIINLPPHFHPISMLVETPQPSKDNSASTAHSLPSIVDEKEDKDPVSTDEKDDRDPATASKVITRTLDETRTQIKPLDERAGKKKEEKQKGHSSTRFFSTPLSHYHKGAKGLQDIQDKINPLLNESSQYNITESVGLYALTSYVISGLLQIREVIGDLQLPYKRGFLKNISAIRNALVHNQIESAELQVNADVLKDLAVFIKEFNSQNRNLKTCNEFLQQKIALLKQQKLTDVDPIEKTFFEKKITQYSEDLKRIYAEIKAKSEKMGQNRFYVVSNFPELREAAAEIISKIVEYYNRCSKLSGAKKLAQILSRMREFRNNQYHETDERASAGLREYAVTPNSDSEVLDLLEELNALFSQKKAYSGQAFLSNSFVSHSSSSSSSSSSPSSNMSYGRL